MYIGNVMLVILNMPLIGIWVQLLKVPYKILMPLIITISAMGIFATDNNVFDMWVMFFFGLVGYVMRKLDYPRGADGSGAGPGTDGGDVAPPVADDLARKHRDLLHPSHLRGADGHRPALPLLPPLPNPLGQVPGAERRRRKACKQQGLYSSIATII